MGKNVSWDNNRYSSTTDSSGKVGPLQQNRGYDSGKSFKPDTGIDLGWLAIIALPFILLYEWSEKSSSKQNTQSNSGDFGEFVGFIFKFALFYILAFVAYLVVVAIPALLIFGDSTDPEKLSFTLGEVSVPFSLVVATLLTLRSHNKEARSEDSKRQKPNKPIATSTTSASHTYLPDGFSESKLYDQQDLRAFSTDTLLNIFRYTTNTTTWSNTAMVIYEKREFSPAGS